MAKTDWQMGDTVLPDDLNQIGQEINQNRDNLAAHTAATTGVHGATSAATPNTIVQRDPAGRFKAAAPAEADDVARKAELDSVIDSLNAHTGRTDNPHHTTADQVGAPSLTKIVPDGTSLNTVTTSGFYRLGINHQDAPSGVDYGQMIVSRGGDTILQIVTGFNNNEFYIRHGNPPEAGGAGVWQPWSRIWTNGNDFDMVRAKGTVLSNFDWNTIVEPGMYQVIDGNWVNGPTNVYRYGTLLVLRKLGDGVTNTQIYITHGRLDAPANSWAHFVYRGGWNDGSWTDWRKPVTSDTRDVVLDLLKFYGGIDLQVPAVPPAAPGRMYANGANGQLYYHDLTNWQPVWTAGNLPYETGGWTPELRFGGQNTGITYAFRGGQYTRIANVVYWTFAIELSSKGSASGIARIDGLPFDKGAGLDFFHAVGRTINIAVPSGQWLSSYIVGTTVYPATNTGSYISSAEFANNSSLRASGFYFIS